MKQSRMRNGDRYEPTRLVVKEERGRGEKSRDEKPKGREGGAKRGEEGF
jgi:hypothetical protein